MGEIKDADKDIDTKDLLFIGSNWEKINFFRTPLNFLSVIYNGETSIKEAEFLQKNLEKKIEELGLSYEPKNAEEKNINRQSIGLANDMLEYRDKISEAFRDGTWSEHLKTSDAAAYDYVLKTVKHFIQKIESMSENIKLSLFEDLFETSSPVVYAKELINTKNQIKTKKL